MIMERLDFLTLIQSTRPWVDQSTKMIQCMYSINSIAIEDIIKREDQSIVTDLMVSTMFTMNKELEMELCLRN